MSQPSKEAGTAPWLLVVDDNDLGRRAVERYFRRDFAVTTARDGAEGLQKALDGRFDLILSDMDMPRMGGREMHERLVAAVPGYREHVVFMTGGPNVPEDREWLESGRAWVGKPVGLSELREMLMDRVKPWPE